MSNDPLDEPMDWGPGEPGPTPRENAAQSAKLAEFMDSLPPLANGGLANGGPVHGEIKFVHPADVNFERIYVILEETHVERP